MGKVFSAELHGMVDLQAAFKTIAKAGQLDAEAMQQAAEPIVSAAKAIAPVQTGELRDSIHAIDAKHGQAGAEITITADADHAVQVEFGTVDTSPQPFLRPAVDGQKDKVRDSLGKSVWTNVLKHLSSKGQRP